MAETTTATSLALGQLGLHAGGGVADMHDIRNRRAAEFLHNARHGRSRALKLTGIISNNKPRDTALRHSRIAEARRRIHTLHSRYPEATGARGPSCQPQAPLHGRLLSSRSRASMRPRSPASNPPPPNGGTARGKFRPLHRMNPTRVGYIRDALCRHFDRTVRRAEAARRSRASPMSVAAAACCASRWPGSAPSVTGIDAGAEAVSIAPAARRADGAGDRVPSGRPPRLSPRRARRTTQCWRWRSSSTSPMSRPFWPPSPALLRPGRRADHVDPEPHARRASAWRSSARNTCCAGCRAAPMTGANSSAPANWPAGLRAPRTPGRRRAAAWCSARFPAPGRCRNGIWT